MIIKKNINQTYIYSFIFILLTAWFFFINYGNVIFDYSYRNNTIYFPVDYNLANLKKNPFSQAEYDWGWGLPGGFIEKKESPKQTAIRELKEETNIKIENIKLFKKFYRNGNYNCGIDYVFFSKVKKKTLSLKIM